MYHKTIGVIMRILWNTKLLNLQYEYRTEREWSKIDKTNITDVYRNIAFLAVKQPLDITFGICFNSTPSS